MLEIEFIIIFQLHATRLAADGFAQQWAYAASLDSMITPEFAAGWANLGYTPIEATWEMADGLTLDAARRIP